MNALFVFAAEDPNGWFIPGDPKELYFGAAAFAVVLYFLVTKLFPIINKALADRGSRIASDLAAADEAQARADAEVAALTEKLARADHDARDLVENARAQAIRLKADSAAKAEADAATVRARAQADVEAMRAQASADIQAEVSAAALAVAQEVTQANLDSATQARLIDQYIEQLGARA